MLCKSNLSATSSFRDIFLHFEDHELPTKSVATQKSYAYLRKHILSCKGNIGAVSHAQIDRAISGLSDRPGLYKRARAAILRVCAYAQENGWRGAAASHHAAKVRLGRIARWSREQVETALTLTAEDRELRAAIALIYYTAQRLVDIVRLGDSQVEGDMIRVYQSKTAQEVFPPVTSALRQYLPTGRRWFTSTPDALRERWRRHSRTINLGGLTLHGLRKSASCEAAEGGASMAELQGYLGHRSIRSSAIYFQDADKAKLAAAAAARRFVHE